MIFKDYYRILELETNRVSIDEIKQTYRELAKKYHPDVNISNKFSEERFKDINEAYRVLSNSSSKRKYDRMWNNYVGNKKKKEFEESKRSSDSPVSDFFNMFFGNIREDKDEVQKKNKKPMIKGENIETEISTTIEEAFYGIDKKISLRTSDGKIKTISVKIPEGILNGEKVRLIGQGKQGENGGKNGDLYLKINIENDSRFELQGYDLYTDLYLTPWEAALGTRANVKTIDDETKVYIPQGTESGEKVRIPGKGYKKASGARGDLVAEIKIMIPKKLTEEEKNMFEKLNEISNFNPRSMND